MYAGTMLIQSQGVDQLNVMPLIERSVDGQNVHHTPVGQCFYRNLNDLGFTKLWILD